MSNIKRTEEFAATLWKIILNVATDNAVRMDDDTGFSVTVSKDDIRNAIECKRVSDTLFNVVESWLLAKAPYLTTSRVKDGLKITVAPLLAARSDFDVSQLKHQADVIELVNKSASRRKLSGRVHAVRVLNLPEKLSPNTVYYHPNKAGKLAITVVGNVVGSRLSTEDIIEETQDA